MAGLVRNIMLVGIMAVLSPVNQGDEGGATAVVGNVMAATYHGKPATGSAQDAAAKTAATANALARGWSELDPNTREVMLAMAVSGLKDHIGNAADDSRKPVSPSLFPARPGR